MTFSDWVTVGLACAGAVSLSCTAVAKALTQLAPLYPWAAKAAPIVATIGYDLGTLSNLIGSAKAARKGQLQ